MRVEIVGPFFDESASLDSLDQLFWVPDLEDNDLLDSDVFCQKIGLPNRAGNPVEKEELRGGEVSVCGNQAMDEVVPNLDGDFIG